MKQLKKYLLIWAVLPLILFSCDDPISLNLFTLQDDVNLGTQLDQEIRANPNEYRMFNSSYQNYNEIQNYLNVILSKIIASPEIKYKDVFPYQIALIHNDEVVNAFATPGGFLYIYTGLMKFVENEATLAGVIAHEVAHAEQRHATNRMTKAYGLQVLLGIALGNEPGQIEAMAGNLFSGLYLLQNSRDDEFEADEWSFKYLQSTEYFSGAIKFFFEKIADNQGGTFLETLLLTHPDPDDRLLEVNKMIEENNLVPDESNLFSTRYQQMISLLPS